MRLNRQIMLQPGQESGAEDVKDEEDVFEILTDPNEVSKVRDALEKQFREENSALAAAREGLADDVIEPAETRRVLIAAMEFLAGKQDEVPLRKHGNMPL